MNEQALWARFAGEVMVLVGTVGFAMGFFGLFLGVLVGSERRRR